MSVKTISRIIGSVVAIVAIMALYFLDRSEFPSWINIWWAIGTAVVAAIIMFIITPYITVMPYHWMRNTAASDLLAAVIGLIVGLIISVLLGIPLSNLPANLGHILPFVGAVVFSCLGVAIAVQRKNDIMHLFQSGFIPRRTRERDREREREDERAKEREKESASQLQPVTQILLDTSAIIDGRIADISQTGFVSGALIVPRFVLNELQHIADSADTMRRNRGRRGLEMLNRLQKDATVPIEITDADVDGIIEVDSKLVKLAQILHCPIITNDFNLNRVAELQGVKVLNINELANAVKPVLLPGEDIVIKIIQDGKELGQGVGYLDDGTMIVVEGGRQYMGSTIEVSVTRVLQTVAGRMIFAHPKQQGGVSSVPSLLPPPSSTTK
ncbi:MAG TPA: PIN domain-containing protein, partial [Ktedonobacteraceae bacterium]|nr:PIN domain-containing protein [Ktedonobacteraceae bacterium]